MSSFDPNPKSTTDRYQRINLNGRERPFEARVHLTLSDQVSINTTHSWKHRRPILPVLDHAPTIRLSAFYPPSIGLAIDACSRAADC